MFKSILSRITFVIFILFLILSCSGGTTTSIAPRTELPSYSSPFPLESFVKINIYMAATQIGSGSGAIIQVRGHESIVLTAAHVCQSRQVYNLAHILREPVRVTISDIEGVEYKAVVFALDEAKDLCLMITSGIKRPAMKISPHPPLLGEEYRNMSAPLGIPVRWGIPLFKGYYSGTLPEEGRTYAIYGIPVQEGSSGSPIFDAKTGIVGIVLMKLSQMESVALSSTHPDLIEFLTEHLGTDLFKIDAARSR
jgi:S1-C subfamily serine protease